jgi:hypothetical protein
VPTVGLNMSGCDSGSGFVLLLVHMLSFIWNAS